MWRIGLGEFDSNLKKERTSAVRSFVLYFLQSIFKYLRFQKPMREASMSEIITCPSALKGRIRKMKVAIQLETNARPTRSRFEEGSYRHFLHFQTSDIFSQSTVKLRCKLDTDDLISLNRRSRGSGGILFRFCLHNRVLKRHIDRK